MSDIQLDHLIDSVAREMTAGDPPALRAAVMSRLRPRRSRLASRSWIPYAAAAAAALLISALVIRSPRVVEPRVPAPAASVANAVPPIREVASVAPAVRVAPGVRATSTPHGTTDDFGIPALPALAPLDPAAAAPIQPEPLAIPPLTVQPMKELAPLTIAALGDIDRRP